jgi:hypothetical protein
MMGYPTGRRERWGRFEWDITLLPGHFTGGHIMLGGIYRISCRLHFLGVHEVKTCLIVSPTGAVPNSLDPRKNELTHRRRVTVVPGEDSAPRRPRIAPETLKKP